MQPASQLYSHPHSILTSTIQLYSLNEQDLILASALQLSPRANIKLNKMLPLYNSSEI